MSTEKQGQEHEGCTKKALPAVANQQQEPLTRIHSNFRCTECGERAVYDSRGWLVCPCDGAPS